MQTENGSDPKGSTGGSEIERAEADYQATVLEHLPRNYVAHLIHGLLGQTGFRLVNAPTFVPAYVGLLSGSEIAVGAALALQYLGASISSIFGANFIEHRKRVLPIGFVSGGLMRLQILGLALGGFFLSPEWALVTTFVFLGLFGLFNGAQWVIFGYLMSKVIPVEKRGLLTGFRNFLAGITAAGVAYMGGTYFVDGNVLGNGYATTFLCAFILTTLGLAMLMFVKEPEPPHLRSATPLYQRFKEIPGLLSSDMAYTRFFIARAATAFGYMSMPFFILYAGRDLGITGYLLAILSTAFMLAGPCANLIWGVVADRVGNRRVFLASIGVFVASTLTLFVADTVPLYFLVFAGVGASFGGFQISSQNLILEFGARPDLPMRIGISNSATSLMTGLGSLLGGIIAQTFGLSVVFVLGIIFQITAFLVVLFTVDEPRYRS